MTKLGELVEVKDLRTVWPNEAADFTPWLAKEKNIARLGDTIGVEITDVETESGVGAFSVDIFATEDGTGRRIIIENQLEDTNHDHLGKLITYAAGKDASIIIWIVKNAREEHRAAIEWLNSRTTKDVSFFLCEIKLYKIGDSAPAVKFDVVEKPNDWAKNAKQNQLKTHCFELSFFRKSLILDMGSSHLFFRCGAGSPGSSARSRLSGQLRMRLQILPDLPEGDHLRRAWVDHRALVEHKPALGRKIARNPCGGSRHCGRIRASIGVVERVGDPAPVHHRHGRRPCGKLPELADAPGEERGHAAQQDDDHVSE